MKISSFKLTTSEEIIGYCETRGDYVVISKPRTVVLMPVGNSYGIAFMPWSNCNPDAEAYIYQQHIVAEFQPMKDVTDAYIQKVSGIDLSSKIVL